ncbi:S8 family serine peptidase [Sphingomonas sp. NBWT7]|uniref:S8 family serine peptidase n=1 Tax=Sphingomonas sp. NBWT7 TaxID=2596913 RepID=UPI001623D9F9|nr:S8 family serine peptidase [Sphingomonas sp. NBWT7]QNE33010.1 S8 family serine peptidase [Sphingomonas sp. NBWT7]
MAGGLCKQSAFRGAIIVAGAGTARRAIARWSNRAGSTADYFLVAPGERLPVDCDTRTCSVVSGSSYSVSYVAGAAALLIGRNPDRSARQIAEALLDSAHANQRPRHIAGRRALDVARAMKAAEKPYATS